MKLMSADALLEQYRPALTGHCYRMLGSVVDAEDAVQEAMLRAWKGRERFREESSVKTWLYRIATNVCLDALAATDDRIAGMTSYLDVETLFPRFGLPLQLISLSS